MARLNKSASGLLYYDDFQHQSLLWTLSPSDANNLRFGSDGLQMLHNRRYTTYTITEPTLEEYSCIVEIDHDIFDYDDIAGVIIISNDKEYAECQSFLATGPSGLQNSNLYQTDIANMIKEMFHGNYVQWSMNEHEPEDIIIDSGEADTDNDSGETTTETPSEEPFVDVFYKYIKFTKQKYKYVFWASTDGITWIEVGNVKFADSNVIGFFIYGTEKKEQIDNSHFVVKSMAIYNSRYITIDNISRDYEFEIYTKDGVVLRTDDLAYYHLFSRSNTSCLINTTHFPMPMKDATLRLFYKHKYDTTIEEYDLGRETYGGDAFILENNIEVYHESTLLDPDTLYNLGQYTRGSQYVTIYIKNKEHHVIPQLKISIVQYSEYYGGEEEIMIAEMDGEVNNTTLTYSKQIIIRDLEPERIRYISLRISDKTLQTLYLAANLYRFKIVIE